MKKLCIFVLSLLMAFACFGVEADTTLKFGFVSFYPPYVLSGPSGHLGGLDVQIVQALCKQLKVKCTYVQAPLDELLAKLNNNQMDAVMGAISSTPERKNLYTFTQPYLQSTLRFIANAKAALNPTPENLKYRNVGVLKDSIAFTDGYAHFPQVNWITYNTVEQLITAISNQQLDLILLDSRAAAYWVAFNSGQLRIVGDKIAVPGDAGYSIMMKKGNDQLAEKLNQAISHAIKNKQIVNRMESDGIKDNF